MTEKQIADYISSLFKQNGITVSATGNKIGYKPETIYYWLRLSTHITLDGLSDILQYFDQQPAVKADGKYYRDILGYLKIAIMGKKKEVYALFPKHEYGRKNIKAWTTGERKMKVAVLIKILNVLGAELVILKRGKNERTL